MTDHKFKVGEVVVLKINIKTKLTIIKINEDGTYKCFYKKGNKYIEENFPEEALRYHPGPPTFLQM